MLDTVLVDTAKRSTEHLAGCSNYAQFLMMTRQRPILNTLYLRSINSDDAAADNSNSHHIIRQFIFDNLASVRFVALKYNINHIISN